MQSAATISPSNSGIWGLASRIDLSAWISGLSFAAGVGLAGPASIQYAAISGRPVLATVTLAFAAFIATVLVIQRHMRLSLLACTFGTPQRLVTSGIFQYSRNPIYVAFFVPLASLAILSLSAAIAATAIYILAMTQTVIRKEERDLEAAFGAEFTTYMARVPRWLI
jgi:protein-S-isoprenylcysteine O-methyltransferase Ste14